MKKIWTYEVQIFFIIGGSLPALERGVHFRYINSVRTLMKINEQAYQGTIGVLVIIVLALGWWIGTHSATTLSGSVNTDQMTPSSNSSSSTTGSASTATQTPLHVTDMMGESVSIPAQHAGMEVSISSLTLSEPAWVAIRDSNGKTLGAALFDAGTHTDVSVPLLRGTEVRQSYQALLYADDGDHQFDLHKDVLISSGGSVAGTTFMAQ